MRNTVGLRECLETVYLHGASLEGGGMIPNDEDLPLLLDRVYPSHEIVKIDYFLPGCPPPEMPFGRPQGPPHGQGADAALPSMQVRVIRNANRRVCNDRCSNRPRTTEDRH